MTGQGLIVKLPHHIAIEGADRIVKCIIAGETIITQKSNTEGTLGILFDCETQLSHEMCYHNNLYSNSELNADKTVKGYIGDNRRIRPIKLKGVKVSGMWMPLDSINWTGVLSDHHSLLLSEGDEINTLNGKEVCNKYITPKQARAIATGKSQKLPKQNLVPTFKEHIDTNHWGRNIHRIKEGDYLVITEKLHGTSFRVGYLQAIHKPLNKLVLWLANNILRLNLSGRRTGYEYAIGSRRVVKRVGEVEKNEGGFYGKLDIWSLAAKQFEDKLHKGETVYGEIVGYLPDGGSIMPSHDNTKLKNFMSKDEYKSFITKYGNVTKFDYGCQHYPFNDEPSFAVYIYRITMTNEDGVQVDLSWEQVKGRCEELGVKHVPELFKGIISERVDGLSTRDGYLEKVVDDYTNEDSDNFPTHIREGVCIRVEDKGFNPTIYKSKAYLFKVLEGIIKENEQYVDVEETN